MIQTFTHPRSCRLSEDFLLEVNGHSVEILRTEVADFAIFVYDATQGDAHVTVSIQTGSIEEYVIRPLSVDVRAQLEGERKLNFKLTKANKLSVEIDGFRPLYIWANAPEVDVPREGDPKVRFFKAGQVYEVGHATIGAGETFYIEGGAVVKGRISGHHADHVSIRGLGILDGSFYDLNKGMHVPSILLESCNHVDIRDITMIHPSGWMIVPGACEHVEICNVKQIGEVMCSDGIDIVGSKHVHIHDCFLRNNDDCVVVKAFNMQNKKQLAACVDFRICPEDILIEDCTFANDPSGNAMEIGHELSVDRVSGVTFRNIDVLSVHGQGAVFSIHNNDRAVIEDILFEDIRIEHCWDKMIDFRISKSRFSSDDERGHIRNVTLRDVNWHRPANNEGYTISIIGGWDAEHLIEDVTIDNFCINGVPVQHIDELEITTRHAKNVCLVEDCVSSLV